MIDAATPPAAAPATQGEPVAPAATPVTPVVAPETPAEPKSVLAAPEGTPPSGEPKGQEPALDYSKVTFPEGLTVDEKFVGSVKELAAKHKIPPEALQDLVGTYALQAQIAQQAAEQESATWFGQLEKDPEIGGAKFQESALAARKAILQFGGPVDKDGRNELQKELIQAGLDNWPPLVKFFVKLGSTIKDDTVSGKLMPPPTPTAKTDDDAFFRELYPNTKF